MIRPKYVLDVGVGDAIWGEIVRRLFPDCILYGVEIFSDYIKDRHHRIYDHIFIEDIRDFEFVEGDMIIFGDVLEHMKKEEALEVVRRAMEKFKFAIINSPLGFLAQNPVHGNEHERHICGLKPEDFCEYIILQEHINRREIAPLFNILITKMK
jgi:trans-aconitate methyltransferase